MHVACILWLYIHKCNWNIQITTYTSYTWAFFPFMIFPQFSFAVSFPSNQHICSVLGYTYANVAGKFKSTTTIEHTFTLSSTMDMSSSSKPATRLWFIKTLQLGWAPDMVNKLTEWKKRIFFLFILQSFLAWKLPGTSSSWWNRVLWMYQNTTSLYYISCPSSYWFLSSVRSLLC